MGRVFSVPVGQNFLSAVIKSLCELDNMMDAVVYVPTRRLSKALQTEILRHSDGQATLMPVIKTLGDGDDIVEMQSILIGKKIPMSVDILYRRFWLSDAIIKFYKRTGEDISLSMALASADDLGQLFDKVALFETDFIKFETLFEEGDYAKHWGYSLVFLNAIYPAWISHLSSLNVLDKGQYQLECLNALNDYLSNQDKHIFLVGATANYPIIKQIMKTVSGIDNGTVFIAGYNTDFTEVQQRNITNDATHPMHTLQDFVNEVGVGNIKTLGVGNNDTATDGLTTTRADVFKSVFLPAKDTVKWRDNPLVKSAFNGLSFSTADDINTESMSIALMMRNTLETEGKTCALMTPDRRLSRMVISHLKRWNIDVDDSSGQPLSSTTPALFMALVLNVVIDDFSVKSIASLLKHPFCTLGMDRGVFNRTAQGLEMFGLRGYFGVGGIDTIIKHIETLKDDKFEYNNPHKNKADDSIALLKKLELNFAPMLQDQSDFASLVKSHIMVCENLCPTDDLWNKDDGNALAESMSELLKNANQIGAVSVTDYNASFGALLSGKTVRKTIGLHPRLFIWGPLEARLQNVDLMIIGGMNEGVFPKQIKTDAWLSRAMAGEVGLPIADWSVGVSANDFITACNGADIVFSRSAKENGKQTIASRWWQRFNGVAKASGFDALPRVNFDYTQLSNILDKPSNADINTVKISVPKPTPRLSSRPIALSVTNIQTWMEDPYQIYAKYILRLHTSGDLWGNVNPAIKGNLLHTIFEEFINLHPNSVEISDLDSLISIGKIHFGDLLEIPEVKGFWWTSFMHTAPKFIEACVERNKHIVRVFTEQKGKYTHTTVGENKFTISGTADRIEVLQDNYCVISDYKTGSSPISKSVKNGTAPQLGLEAYMLGQGAFENIDSCHIERVEIWESKPNFKVHKYGDGENPISDIVKKTIIEFDRLVDKFADENTPYYIEQAKSKYNDYTHLMREKEWGLFDDECDVDGGNNA